MEDDNGIELSLGLSCGGSSSKLKINEGDLNSKAADNFRSFLPSRNPNQDSGQGSQQTNPQITHDNFFSKLTNRPFESDEETPKRGIWVMNNNTSIEGEEEKPYQNESCGKRKMLFESINLNHPRKHAKGDDPDINSQASHINTENGLTAEKEDVAESEAPKENRGHISDSNGANLQGQNQFTKESEFMSGSHGGAYANAGQPLKMTNVPYSAPSASSHLRPNANVASSNNVPHTFGYSPVQLPTLEKEYTWSLGPSNPHQFPPSYAVKETRGVTQTTNADNDGPKVFQDFDDFFFGKGDGKQMEIINNAILSPEHQPIMDVLSTEGLGIRPGIHANLEFGGCGSIPNLPWVSTTGQGPNGKTVSGVPYKFSADQIKIVCACHSSHLTPQEFADHGMETHENGAPDAELHAKNPV